MRKILSWIKRLIQLALLVVLGGLVWMYLQDPVLTSRLVLSPITGNQGPLEVVDGGPKFEIPVSSEEDRSILPDALNLATAYGEETDSHALIVFHDGALQLEKYYSDYSAGSISPTQSMHKSVLAVLVGIAIRDGYIKSVDDEVGKYLEEWSQDERGKITLRQMLQQASGIDYPTIGFNPLQGFFQLVLGKNTKAVVLNQSLLDKPGARFDYNSVNPQILGIVLERATGQKYSKYLSSALWRHIGAEDARVVLDSVDNATARTFCCLGATARSWLMVGLLHLGNGSLSDRQVVPQWWMRQIVTPSTQNPNYGFLTWLGTNYAEERGYNQKTSTSVYQSEPFAAEDVIYFDGFGGSRVYVVPSQGLVIVRTGDIALDWDDAYLPNTIIRGLRK